MPIKMGSNHTTVFNTVNMLVNKKGMAVEEAIEEVEKILRCQLPEDIKNRIKEGN